MRLTKEDAELQRQNILEEAYKEFMAKGYAAAKIEEIAAQAGVSRSPVYYYFDNKQALFETVVEYHFENIEDKFHAIFEKQENFFDLVREQLQFVEAHDEDQGAGYIVKDITNTAGNSSKDRMKLHIQRVIQMDMDAVKRAIARGQLKQHINAENLVRIIFTFYYGLISTVEHNFYTRAGVKGLIDEFLTMIETVYSN